MLFLYTPKGLERNGRGVPTGTVDPENAMPFEGRQVTEVKMLFFIPVFGENGSNPNQMIPSCPPVLLVDFLRKFFCERKPNKTLNRQKKTMTFSSHVR